MLQLIRENAQGIVIWVIVGLVILGLSSFILTDYLGGNVKTYVARVNDTEISERQFRQAYSNYQQRLREQLGDNFPRFMDEKFLRESVINGLIDNELLRQLTLDAGLRADALQIYRTLQGTEQFHDAEGKFSAERYRELLGRVGYTAEAYEADLAQSIVQDQLLNGVQSAAFVPAEQVNDYQQLLHQQRDVAYLLVNKAELSKTITVSDEQISEFYEANKQQFMTEEQVKVAYLELNQADMAKAIEVDEEEMLAYYEEHKISYSKQDFAAAEKQIKDIAARIKKGEAFEELARTLSQDPGTAINGGDLGFFPRGVMAKPFEDAVFSMQAGDVSEPVRTEFGYHLIKLEEVSKDGEEQRRARHILIKPAQITQPFAEVKQRIKGELQMQRAERTFYQDADMLDRLAYQHQDSLEPAAAELGHPIKESPFFSRRGGAQIWGNRDVVETVFSDEVLKEGLNSELIKLSDDHVLVLRLRTHKPAEQKSLDSVKTQVEARLRDQKAEQQAREIAQQALADIQAGKAPAQLAAAHPALSWQEPGLIGRQPQYDPAADKAADLPQELRAAVYRMRKPDAAAQYQEVTLGNGDAAVVVLRAVRDSAGDIPEQERQALQRQLTQQSAQAQSRLILDFMRARSEIEITKQSELEDY